MVYLNPSGISWGESSCVLPSHCSALLLSQGADKILLWGGSQAGTEFFNSPLSVSIQPTTSEPRLWGAELGQARALCFWSCLPGKEMGMKRLSYSTCLFQMPAQSSQTGWMNTPSLQNSPLRPQHEGWPLTRLFFKLMLSLFYSASS